MNRYPLVTIAVMCVGAALLHLNAGPISWHFFRTAGRVVTDGGLLHIYATHPDLQFGPLTFLLTAPIALLPTPVDQIVAGVGMILLGVLTLWLIYRSFPPRDARSSTRWWMASAVGALAWSELAIRYGHLDDSLALALVAAATLALRRRHYPVAAMLLALSTDAKPWTLPLVGLLLLADRRRWLALLALWSGIVGVFWLPFAVESLHSINAARFAIPIAPASTLTLLPITDTATPQWCRIAQIIIGAALVLLAVRRGSIAAAVLGVFAVRLLLDPGVWSYYDIEVILGAILCDMSLMHGRIPLFTAIAGATVYLPTYLLTAAPHIHAWVRTGGLVAVVIMAFILAFRQRPEGRQGFRGWTASPRSRSAPVEPRSAVSVVV